MKPVLILFGISLATFPLLAQNLKETEVPAAVKNTFATMFPEVKDVKWEKEQGMFEAGFKDHKLETSALFTAKGMYVQREVEIQEELLPQGVRDYVSKNLAGKKINESALITDASGKIEYEAEVSNVDYLFDADGNFIKKESEENDTDNDKE